MEVGRIQDLPGAPPVPTVRDPERSTPLRAEVCVVGGGSGGLGAALAAARSGSRVLLIERGNRLGGTSTLGGIANWEPGPGDDFAREIAARLAAAPPGLLMDKPRYEDTLTRAGNGHIQFDPLQFHRVVHAMLAETRRCRVLYNTSLTTVRVAPGAPRILELEAVDRQGAGYTVQAQIFIDCTGSGFLCQAAGCQVMLGAEAKAVFGEPHAPDKPEPRLNALELVYRIRPSQSPVRQPLPAGQALRRGGAAWPQPTGERFVNSCGGLAPGWLLIEKGWLETRRELERRARAHWHWLQQTRYPQFEFAGFAPMLAIREAQRIAGEYILTEHDLVAGIRNQEHPDIIAVADHPMDTHGARGGLLQVAAPYGIPFRCLVPKGGWRNLLIACRGAGFSHIAASSCRLSRTMIALGHAAGLAAAQCLRRNCEIPDVDVAPIQRRLLPPALAPWTR